MALALPFPGAFVLAREVADYSLPSAMAGSAIKVLRPALHTKDSNLDRPGQSRASCLLDERASGRCRSHPVTVRSWTQRRVLALPLS